MIEVGHLPQMVGQSPKHLAGYTHPQMICMSNGKNK